MHSSRSSRPLYTYRMQTDIQTGGEGGKDRPGGRDRLAGREGGRERETGCQTDNVLERAVSGAGLGLRNRKWVTAFTL